MYPTNHACHDKKRIFMDDAAKKELLAEYEQAQAEHARALSIAQQARERLKAARNEYEQVHATQQQSDHELNRATQQLTMNLEAIHLDHARAPLPMVTDSLVEYHANIGCYHCYLRVEKDAYVDVDTSEMQVVASQFPFVHVLAKTDGNDSAPSKATTTWWKLEVERQVECEACVVTCKTDHVYVRLPVSSSNREIVDGFASFSQLTAPELEVRNYARMSCQSCQSTLRDEVKRSHPMERVLPLPSANWMDMFDFWGAGIGSFEHLPREGITSQMHRVLVGESHVLVHADDLIATALVDASSSSEQRDDSKRHGSEGDWSPVACAQCLVIVGARSHEEATTIRLEKHLISSASLPSGPVTSVPSNQNIFARYTIDSTICTQMLHMAEADGVFRFILTAVSEPTETTSTNAEPPSPVHLQLLSWDTKLKTSETQQFQRVLKVSYRIKPVAAPVENHADRDDTVHALDDPSPVPRILREQELTVPSALLAEITTRLQHSTTMLPPSLREFNRMAVGYLYT